MSSSTDAHSWVNDLPTDFSFFSSLPLPPSTSTSTPPHASSPPASIDPAALSPHSPGSVTASDLGSSLYSMLSPSASSPSTRSTISLNDVLQPLDLDRPGTLDGLEDLFSFDGSQPVPDFGTGAFQFGGAGVDEAFKALEMSLGGAPIGFPQMEKQDQPQVPTISLEPPKPKPQLGKRKTEDVDQPAPAAQATPAPAKRRKATVAVKKEKGVVVEKDKAVLDVIANAGATKKAKAAPRAKAPTAKGPTAPRFPHPPTEHTFGGPKNPSHNAVERRYRNNINSRILALRHSVPALLHPPPPQTSSRRKPPSVYVEGVAVPNKINKQTVLAGATAYIRWLRGREARLMREVETLRAGLGAGRAAWEEEWGVGKEVDEVEDLVGPEEEDEGMLDGEAEDGDDAGAEEETESVDTASPPTTSAGSSSAPRYLLALFLSFSLFSRPLQSTHHVPHLPHSTGSVLSSTLAPHTASASPSSFHLLPLLHPHLHDLLHTLLLLLTLFVLSYPLLFSRPASPTPERRRRALRTLRDEDASPAKIHAALGELAGVPAAWSGRAAGCVGMAVRWAVGKVVRRSGKVAESEKERVAAYVRRAEIEVSMPTAFSRLQTTHTLLSLLTLPLSTHTPRLLASAALLSRSPGLWARAQAALLSPSTRDSPMPTPKHVSLALSRPLPEALALLRSGSSAVIDPLSHIAAQVASLALRELWQKLFVSIAALSEDPATARPATSDEDEQSNEQIITRAVASLVSSTELGSRTHELALVSAGTWALLCARHDLARDVAERIGAVAQEYEYTLAPCAKVYTDLVLPSSSSSLSLPDLTLPPVPSPLDQASHQAATALSFLLLRAQTRTKHAAPTSAATLYEGTVRVRQALALAADVGTGGGEDEQPGEEAVEDAREAMVDWLVETGRRAAGWADEGYASNGSA